MKIVFSRKGFDFSTGGAPSPIVEGCPVSLPIPAGVGRPGIAYDVLGMGDMVHAATRGRLDGRALAHHDPMFLADGTCLFGQCGAAQSHLENQGVGTGDLFLFFGLFREEQQPAHHRIFGWLRVRETVRPASCDEARLAQLRTVGHPHALQCHAANDVIWCGPGGTAGTAHADLRLSVEQGPASRWRVPAWLFERGLTYHARPDRWLAGGILQSVGRGQEFVTDTAGNAEARRWADRIVSLMRSG